MKILYFTATGNSLYIAKSIAEANKGELLSIPKMVKEERYDFTDEKIGIVCPVYGWSVPLYVENFLRKAKFNSNYIFGVLTYGIYHSGAANQLVNISNESDFKFSYINTIKMVDNFLPTFNMEQQIRTEYKKKIEEHLEIIKSDIVSSKKWILKNSFFNKMVNNFAVNRAKKTPNKEGIIGSRIGNGIKNLITVEESCIGCGICAKVCPANNIKVDKKNKKITLGNECSNCFACIQNCPTNSIRLKGERSKARYRNKNIQLNEIIEANS